MPQYSKTLEKEGQGDSVGESLFVRQCPERNVLVRGNRRLQNREICCRRGLEANSDDGVVVISHMKTLRAGHFAPCMVSEELTVGQMLSISMRILGGTR